MTERPTVLESWSGKKLGFFQVGSARAVRAAGGVPWSSFGYRRPRCGPIFYTVSISQRTAPLPPSCPCLLPASKFGGVLEFSRDSSELELLTINVRYMYFVWKLVLGCEVLLCDPCARCVCVCPVLNVNTTDATTGGGATALLLPAQNTHTLHDPIRDTEQARRGARSMRALAALSRIGLGVGGLEDGANMAVGCWRRGA